MFSIILPVYNGGELIKETVRAVLNQTIKTFNLIILDNNSDDGTVEWLNSLKDDRIIIHSSKTLLSIEENWARIATIPKNEFVTLIGYDDILHSFYLEEMQNLIAKHPDASLYQAHFTYINIAGQVIKNCQPMDEMQQVHEFLACQFAKTIESTGTGYMMRSKDYDEIGGMPGNFPNLIFADYCLWVQFMLKGYKATSQRICFSYRIHESISKKTNGEIYLNGFEKYVYFLADISRKNERVKYTIEKYGHQFLMGFCEALAHRILKTSTEKRTMSVANVVEKFNIYASLLIPNQTFEPLKVFKIRIANQFDKNAANRLIFKFYKLLRKDN